MPTLWTADLNTGIQVIDNQHKRILDYINKLGQSINQQNRLSVGSVLSELLDYTVSHFAFEESLLLEVGYQYAAPHNAVHEMFIKRLERYQEKHNAGENVAQQLHGMLSTWLLHHIKRDDMAYVSEVNARITRIVQNKKKGSWLSRSLGMFFK